MSKKFDYTKYSKEPAKVKEPVETVKSVEPVIEATQVVEPVESVEPVVEETQIVEPVIEEPKIEESKIEEPKIEEAEPIIGVVANCLKLNVREHADKNADVLTIINEGTELVIIEEESTKDFYKICLSTGLEGYCMKKFVSIMP